jgi:HTH-type transcriptional regulator / antitoxin HigA
MALKLSAAFGNPAAEWLKWDSDFQIATALPETDTSSVGEMKSLYEVAPIRDMERRGWIKSTDDAKELKAELQNFFGAESLDSLDVNASFRRSFATPDLSASERAWYFMARRMAAALQVATFNRNNCDEAEAKLRGLAAYPKEARHLSKVLCEFGIRFVVLEPLPGTRIDGAAFWLNESAPVIAVSVRMDRIDSLWFTVFHEWAHIRNGDRLSIDSDLVGDTDRSPLLVEEESERRANEQAAAALVPPAELQSFIRRVGPLYSKDRIIQFAHRMKIHPGIIVGQLQHLREIGYSANREMLAKVREVVVQTALTDGWGRSISPGLL